MDYCLLGAFRAFGRQVFIEVLVDVVIDLIKRVLHNTTSYFLPRELLNNGLPSNVRLSCALAPRAKRQDLAWFLSEGRLVPNESSKTMPKDGVSSNRRHRRCTSGRNIGAGDVIPAQVLLRTGLYKGTPKPS